MMKAMKTVLSAASCIFLAAVSPAPAQTHARALGMGMAYTAVARGVRAPSYNPANLGLPDNPRSSFTMFSVSAGVGNNAFSKSLYDRLFVEGADEDGKVYWDADDITDLLGAVPENGFCGSALVRTEFLSFSAGRFAFTMRGYGRMFSRIDKEFFQIPLLGNEMNQKYILDNTSASALGIGVVSFSYGHPVEVSFAKAFALGTSLNIMYGAGYASTDRASAVFETASYGFNLQGEYEATVGAGGIGWGADFGAAAAIDEKWNVSVSLNNAVSRIRWNDATTEYGYVKGDSVYAFSLEDDEDHDALDDSSWSVDRDAFSRAVPPVLRVGLSYREDSFILSADYEQGFYESALFSATPRFNFGTEWQGVPWLPLRMGVGLGGRLGTTVSYGFGFHFGAFNLDFALLNRGFIDPKTSKGAVVAVDVSFIPRAAKRVTVSNW